MQTPRTFPRRVSLYQTQIFGRAGGPLHAGHFRVYAWRRAARSRARKGADGRILAREKPGLHDPHRRAADCAPYQLSAPLGRFGARPSWPQWLRVTRIGLRSFCGVEVADQWERQCSGVKRSVVSAGADASAPLARFVARLPTWQMVMAQRHAAMRLYRLCSRARKGAEKTRVKPGSRVSTTHTGPQWTARPTLLSTPQRLSR